MLILEGTRVISKVRKQEGYVPGVRKWAALDKMGATLSRIQLVVIGSCLKKAA
jgi:hypothetical protein